MRHISYEYIEVIILNSLFLLYNTASSATLLSMEDPILFMTAVLLVIEINNDNKSNNNSNGQIINISEKIKDNKKIEKMIPYTIRENKNQSYTQRSMGR